MSRIKLFIPAGKASATPPIGPILGQYRLNLVEFCKDFNEQTVSFNDTLILPVSIKIFNDGEFEYFIKLPTTTFFLKRMLEQERFSKFANNTHIGIVTISQLYELTYLKWMNYENNSSKINQILTLIGTINSTGIYCIY